MRVVVVGNRELARHVLAYLLDTGWNVVGAVASAGDAAREQAGFVPFEAIADAHGVQLINTGDINDESVRRRLVELHPDLCICPGWHQIIDEPILEVPDHGFLGFHASDLPEGRGGAPVNWSIIHGESRLSLSLFFYSKGVDAGDILHQTSVAIEARDDVDTVLDKLSIKACEALRSVRPDLESGEADAAPQSIGEATYRPRRQPQDGIIDWTKSADALADWVRAQTDPYPGAYTFYEGERLTIWSAKASDGPQQGEPGTVLSVVDGEGIDVATGDGTLRLKRVQAGESPRSWADDFAKRGNVTANTTFGWKQAPSSWRYTGIRDERGGTDFSKATNLATGEQGTILAIVKSTREREFQMKAVFDDETVSTSTIATDFQGSISITYEPDTPGVRTLLVNFFEDGERVDQRVLKIFVTPRSTSDLS